MGSEHVYIGGYSPFPSKPQDERLPHIHNKLHKQITKTSLGAENYVSWSTYSDIHELISNLKDKGIVVVALEQSSSSVLLNSPVIRQLLQDKEVALLLGREVEGVDKDLLSMCDVTIEIPMHGKKESLNVANAFAIALYTLKLL